MTLSDSNHLSNVSELEDPEDENSFDEEEFSLNDVEVLLDKIGSKTSAEEPDEDDLVIDDQDIENEAKAVSDDEIITATRVLVELSDDPVRLYLRDIGSINLLDVDHEFWLAARMAAVQRLDLISRKHPIAQRGISPTVSIFRALYAEMSTAWRRIGEDTRRLKYDCPVLEKVFSETRQLRQTWECDQPSYLRTYLDNGLWSKDEDWDEIVKQIFDNRPIYPHYRND